MQKTCRWGEFLLIEGDMISKYADLYGEWSEHEVTLFRNILKPNCNVVEVGANIGLHTVPLSRIVNQGRVICFEPQRPIFDVLKQNCALNNCANTLTENMAVSSQTGTIDIACSHYDQPWNYGAFSITDGFSTEQKFAGEQWTESIAMTTLDDHPAIAELDALRLLKIDVEGLEIGVIKGADALIRKHRPMIFVENNNPESGNALIETIKSLDYECFWFCSERYSPENFNQAEMSIGGGDINMICKPPEVEFDTGPLMRVNDYDDIAQGRARWIRLKPLPALPLAST